MAHDHTTHTYDIVFTNEYGRQLHVYVVETTNLRAIEEAMTQVMSFGNGGSVTTIEVRTLCE